MYVSREQAKNGNSYTKTWSIHRRVSLKIVGGSKCKGQAIDEFLTWDAHVN